MEYSSNDVYNEISEPENIGYSYITWVNNIPRDAIWRALDGGNVRTVHPQDLEIDAADVGISIDPQCLYQLEASTTGNMDCAGSTSAAHVSYIITPKALADQEDIGFGVFAELLEDAS